MRKQLKNKRSHCKHCKKLKVILGRGLCSTCYINLKNEGTLNKYEGKNVPYKESDICSDCGEQQAHSKGLCKKCYTKTYGSFFVGGANVTIVTQDGMTREQMKELVKQERDKVLKRIAKNPKKLLDKIQR